MYIIIIIIIIIIISFKLAGGLLKNLSEGLNKQNNNHPNNRIITVNQYKHARRASEHQRASSKPYNASMQSMRVYMAWVVGRGGVVSRHKAYKLSEQVSVLIRFTASSLSQAWIALVSLLTIALVSLLTIALVSLLTKVRIVLIKGLGAYFYLLRSREAWGS